MLKLPEPHKGATPFAITTAGARSRLGPQHRPNPREYGSEDSLTMSISTAPTRKVRFSDPEDHPVLNEDLYDPHDSRETSEPEEIHVQTIERNYSDLTDTTGYGRESLVSVSSSLTEKPALH